MSAGYPLYSQTKDLPHAKREQNNHIYANVLEDDSQKMYVSELLDTIYRPKLKKRDS